MHGFLRKHITKDLKSRILYVQWHLQLDVPDLSDCFMDHVFLFKVGLLDAILQERWTLF